MRKKLTIIGLIILLIINTVNSDPQTVNVNITSIENIGSNLEVNASFFYAN